MKDAVQGKGRVHDCQWPISNRISSSSGILFRCHQSEYRHWRGADQVALCKKKTNTTRSFSYWLVPPQGAVLRSVNSKRAPGRYANVGGKGEAPNVLRATADQEAFLHLFSFSFCVLLLLLLLLLLLSPISHSFPYRYRRQKKKGQG